MSEYKQNIFLAVIGIGIVLLGFVPATWANIGASWNPDYTSAVITAVAPPNAPARAEEFRNRNSGNSLKQLADRFFAIMDLDKVPPAVREQYVKKDYAAALKAYRDFFMERLIFPPCGYPIGGINTGRGMPNLPLSPVKIVRHFGPGSTSAQDLMSNIVVFGAMDKAGKKVNLPINRGPPGQFNWTWLPEGYTNVMWYDAGTKFNAGIEGAEIISAYLGGATCFERLLMEYATTRDKACLEKWAEFMDDRCMHWQEDTINAGIKVFTEWSYLLEAYNIITWPEFSYLLREIPGCRNDFPPATLARLMLQVWEVYVPICIRAARQDGPNRRIGMRGDQLMTMSRLFPEFKAADYCIREFRRIMEAWPYTIMQPDGTTPEELQISYLLVYPLVVSEFLNELRRDLNNITMPVPYPWMTALWAQEVNERLNLRAKYNFHGFSNKSQHTTLGYTRDYVLETHRHSPFTTMLPGLLMRYFPPEGLADAEVGKIVSTLLDDGSRGAPSFTSEGFPFGGYFQLRTGWLPEDLFLFMHNNPAVQQSGDNLGICLYAYKRDLLWSWGRPPLRVDGYNQMNTWSEWAYFTAYPNKYREWLKKLYGDLKPQPNRWHTSAHFDLCEATYADPFPNAAMPWQPQAPKGKDPYITDVPHHRQVLLERKSGLVVVTDRIRPGSAVPHQYQLGWGFAGPCPTDQYKAKETYGFTPEQIIMDAKGNALHTANSNMANLSIYHFSPATLKMNSEGCNFEGSGNQLVVSALYPRRTIKDELKIITPLNLAGAKASGFGATLPDGTRVFYAGAVECAPLKAGDIEALGEGLLLTVSAEGEKRGVALGCKEIKLGGKKVAVPCADFEFAVELSQPSLVLRRRSPMLVTKPIYRPLEFVRVSPESDRFMDRVEITMTHPEPDVDIRYTLNGIDPTASSPLYKGPFTLSYTTTVKARAFRKGVKAVPPTFSGTEVSSVTRAEYTKEKPLEPATTVAVAPGLKYSYYEGDFSLSALYLDTLVKSKKQGTVTVLFDLSARATSNNFAFVYEGYLDIPRDGVYDFHAPRELVLPSSDAGYDLRVFVDKEEWYPATRPHNFGIWSVALKKGKHAFKVVYVDQRPGEAQWRYPYPQVQPYIVWRGEKPTLEISGPGLAKQPIPAGMLYY